MKESTNQFGFYVIKSFKILNYIQLLIENFNYKSCRDVISNFFVLRDLIPSIHASAVDILVQ